MCICLIFTMARWRHRCFRRAKRTVCGAVSSRPAASIERNRIPKNVRNFKFPSITGCSHFSRSFLLCGASPHILCVRVFFVCAVKMATASQFIFGNDRLWFCVLCARLYGVRPCSIIRNTDAGSFESQIYSFWMCFIVFSHPIRRAHQDLD